MVYDDHQFKQFHRWKPSVYDIRKIKFKGGISYPGQLQGIDGLTRNLKERNVKFLFYAHKIYLFHLT